MVRPGETGYLAPTADTAALREAIVRLLTDRPETRRAMSETCRRIAVEEYSLDVQSRKYECLYAELLAASRKAR
jgi:glycosyltransferase involved in cell wall biosynthesis